MPLLKKYELTTDLDNFDLTAFNDIYDHLSCFIDSYLLTPEELPDCLWRANVFSFAYAVFCGEFSEDQSPYVSRVRHIQDFYQLILELECLELVGPLQKCIFFLSGIPEEDLRNYERFLLKDNQYDLKINRILWDESIKKFILHDSNENDCAFKREAARY